MYSCLPLNPIAVPANFIIVSGGVYVCLDLQTQYDVNTIQSSSRCVSIVSTSIPLQDTQVR
jgi:hypothetical protein